MCNCGEPEHCPSGSRQRPAKCANCSGDHPSSLKVCPSWEKEKKIVKIKVEENITFPEEDPALVTKLQTEDKSN